MLLLLQLYAFFRQTIILYVSLQQLLSSKMKFPSRTKKNAFGLMLKDVNFKNGWGGRIRTSECLDQNQVPYRLATPHYRLHLLFYSLKFLCQLVYLNGLFSTALTVSTPLRSSSNTSITGISLSKCPISKSIIGLSTAV